MISHGKLSSVYKYFDKRAKADIFIRQEAKGSLKLFNYMFQVSTDITGRFPTTQYLHSFL